MAVLMRTLSLSFAPIVLLGSAVAGWCQPPEKKLIEYGWDVPTPTFVAEHIADMEQRPFDGLILRVPNIGQIFEARKWDRTEVEGEFEALARIAWSSFTDNFIVMYAASTMDWFSDADWDCVLHNVGLCAEAAQIGRCVGLCFDPEPYGPNPWHYPSQVHAAERTFADYEQKVRERGAQFVARIQDFMPAPVIHTFFQLSYFAAIATEPDAGRRSQALAREYYGLLPAFLNGMLDAANPGTAITDGNESSYYYTDPLQYYRAFHTIRQLGLGLVAPENRSKYLAQVQCSQALYVDYLFAYWPHATPGRHMTPEERAHWFEHNTYWALTTSDRYVWLYSEKMNWWTNENIPPGLPEAVASAREKVRARAPLGFELQEILDRAREREEASVRERLITRTALIPRLPEGLQPPHTDGLLDDAAWAEAALLEPFLPYLDRSPESVEGRTEARVTYDADALYLAVRCIEPAASDMRILGSNRDDSVWMGDSVDLFLSLGQEPTPYVHIIVNPDNTVWDAYCSADTDTSWGPDYRSATYRDAGGWTVELALPWSALGLAAPGAGSQFRANLCRQRIPGGEQTAWSQCVSGFVEPRSFGTWVLQ